MARLDLQEKEEKGKERRKELPNFPLFPAGGVRGGGGLGPQLSVLNANVGNR